VVKLLINRHNNKYSYTAASDDNLLKNLELFDKLCLRFSGRVLFIKDVIGGNEICCWSFYGHGKKVAEVSTSSIVYATDKKHTKVEFPEARIYEETLNILLYENRIVDTELMQATRGSVGMAASSSTYASDEEDEAAPAGPGAGGVASGGTGGNSSSSKRTNANESGGDSHPPAAGGASGSGSSSSGRFAGLTRKK
jgi:BTB/POZ domain-containing adapter for CUL3-mediated RhoA degradation protein